MRLGVPCCLLLALVVAGSPARAGDDPSAASFAALKQDVEALRRDPERRQFRHHYEALVAKLKKLHAQDPSAQKADDALFVAAQVTEELYYASRTPADRDAAVAAFTALADAHPTSNLADDALLAAARLSTDAAQAKALLERVVAMGAKADLHGEAKAQLAARFPATDRVAAALAKVRDEAASSTPALATTTKSAAAHVAPPPKSAPSSSVASPSGASSAVASSPPAAKAPPAKATPTKADPAAAARAAPLPRPPVVEVLPERPPEGSPARKVVVIRHEKSATESLVRVRLSGDVGITRGEVPPQDGQPRRIFFDLAPAKLGQRNIQPIEVGDHVVARVRAGQYDTDVVRVVVELRSDEEPSLRVQKRPFEVQLSVPVKPADPQIAAAPPPAAPPPPADAPKVEAVAKKLAHAQSDAGVSISQQLGLKVHRIVIDAGHGGHDTGAIGPTGIKEKDVTLAIAKKVRERLLKEMPDVDVILTRESDTTLALQDRTNVANAAGADLFISIHCNASPLKRVRGVETYTLNITSDRYAMKLAARENAEAGEGSISDLEYILADLAMKSNVDDSVRLGEAVQGNVVRRLKKSYDGVKDLGLKHALFYVLMGNHMPSILVETSFLSHKEEEKRLGSDAYQDALAEGIVSGVRAFVEDRQAFYTP